MPKMEKNAKNGQNAQNGQKCPKCLKSPRHKNRAITFWIWCYICKWQITNEKSFIFPVPDLKRINILHFRFHKFNENGNDTKNKMPFNECSFMLPESTPSNFLCPQFTHSSCKLDQRRLSEGEGSVQMTSSLRHLVL